MIKQWKVEREWQEPFLEALRARGASPQACDAALGDARGHVLRIEDAFLFHHVARLDAGGFFDEGAAGPPRGHGRPPAARIPRAW